MHKFLITLLLFVGIASGIILTHTPEPMVYAANPGCITVYLNNFYLGELTTFCEGDYATLGSADQDIGSISAGPDTRYTLYTLPNFEGTSYTLTTSYGDLLQLPCSGYGCPSHGTWFDAARSIRIECTSSSCGGTPDLFPSFENVTSDDPHTAGGTVGVKSRVRNDGDGEAGPSYLGIWVSYTKEGGPIDPSLIKAVAIPSIAAGDRTDYFYTTVSIPTGLADGTYYVTFEADYRSQIAELDEDNLQYDTFTIASNPTPTPVPPTNTPVPPTNTPTPLPSPEITGITPNRGPSSGGTRITINGQDFFPGATVMVGESACSAVTVVSEVEIQCTTPNHSPSTVDVVVTTNGYSAIATNGYTYETVSTPSLSMPSNILAQNGQDVTVAVALDSDGEEISAVTGSIDIPQCLAFDTTDADNDDIPDAMGFSVPSGFVYSVIFDSTDSDGELDFFIYDPMPPITAIPDGAILEITFGVICPGPRTEDIRFSNSPVPSFSDLVGNNLNGNAVDGSVVIEEIAAPAAPKNLTATAVSVSQIDLSWNSVAGAKQYRIERSLNGSSGWVVINTLKDFPTTYSDSTGLVANTTYYYRVVAANDGGDSSPSSVASATTLAFLPDFIIITAEHLNPPHYTGSEITTKVMVQNDSSGAADPITVDAWISTTSFGDAVDPTAKGSASIPLLGANESSPLIELPVSVPSTLLPGTYYLVFAANVDGAVTESNTQNNRYSLEIDIEQQAQHLSVDIPADTCMMLSLPLIAPNSPIETVLGSIDGVYSIVRSFDVSTGTWLKFAPDGPPFGNTLTTIGPTDGLWLCSTQAGELSMSGNYPASIDIPLSLGWNLVGFPVNAERDLETLIQPIEGTYDLVRTYDHATNTWLLYSTTGPAFGNSLHEIQPSMAYWIHVTTETTLTITNP